MKFSLSLFLSLFYVCSFSQKNPVVFNHQWCTSARLVCSISSQPSEGSLCNSSCSGNNNLVNGTNSCFTGGLTRWGFYIFSIEQSGTLTFVINPDSPGFFECGDYNFALFDVTNGCGSIGNAIRCSMADDGCTGANTGLNMTATDTTEGTGGDGWNKYVNVQCGRTYLLCLDLPGNDGNGFTLSFGGTCTFGAPAGFTATPDTVCAGQPVNFSLTCNTSNAWLTYQWNFGPNATPQTFTGPTPPAVTFSVTGNQNVTLTSTFTNSDGNTCVNSTSQNIFVTAGAPTSSFTASSPACLGTNTTVTYTGNASTSATYTWNFGSGTVISGSGQGPYVISYSAPGTYTMSLDVTECATPSGVTTNTITVFPSPTANAGNDASICIGNNTSLSGSGGVLYGWQPSAGLSCTNCSNPVASPTVTTTYTMAVMDANGCTNTDVVTVTVNPLPSANAGADATICAGQNYSLSASGGTSYLWSPAASLSNPNISNPVSSATSSITYTVTVTDANGCSNTDAISLTVNPLPAANAGADVTICSGNNTSLNASGGTSYLWSPSASLSNPSISNPTANPTSSATYTVTVTDANGCSNTDAVTVTVNPLPAANAGADVSICFGFNTSLNASGGINYLWSPSVSLSNPNISNPIASPTSTTTYTVIVSDANGCSNADVITITVNPTPAATVSSANVLCFGGSNGNATATVSVGTNPITYLWNTFPPQSTQTATGLSAGNYSVLITDANGCTTTGSVTITQPAALTASVSSTNVSCYGGNDGTIAVAATGGSGSYTYFWVPSVSSTSSATGLTAQPYTILITDANGCTISASVTITQPSALTATVSSANAGCGMSNGTATAAAAGGASPYNYLWSNGQTASTATNLAQGNYTVTLTDANGCTLTNTITVNQDPPPSAAISGDTVLCLGQSAILTASGGNSYSWNTGATTSSITITLTSTSTYSVIATNGACTDTAAVNVIVNPLPSANAGQDVTITYGSSTVLNGTGGISYNWTPSGSLSCDNCQNPAASPVATTDYIVIATDANGCTDADTVNVFVDLTCKGIYLPNAFSPNGDGENDELRIYTWNISCITDFKIMIYDRWGAKVFQSADADFRWDGRYSHGLLSGEEGSAVFTYILKAEMINGEKVNRKGNISLVR